MIIREMTEKDIKDAADLEAELFGVPWSYETLEDCLNNKLYYLFAAELSGEFAGYICLMEVAGELELMRIGVSGNYQRRGLAAALMDRLLAVADEHGVRDITLEVRSHNVPAIALYEKYGFVTEGIRKKYYHNPEDDALIMWRRTVN